MEIKNLELLNRLSEMCYLLEFYSQNKKLEEYYYLYQFKNLSFLIDNQEKIEQDYNDTFLNSKKMKKYEYFSKGCFEILINSKFLSKYDYLKAFLFNFDEQKTLEIGAILFYNWFLKNLTKKEKNNLKNWIQNLKNLYLKDSFLALEFFEKTKLSGKMPKSKVKTNKLFEKIDFDFLEENGL